MSANPLRPLPPASTEDSTPLIADRAHLAATLLAEAAKVGIPIPRSAYLSDFAADGCDVQLYVLEHGFEAWADYLAPTRLVRVTRDIVTRSGRKHDCTVHIVAGIRDADQFARAAQP